MPNIDFELNTDYIELHKLLKLTGVVDSGDGQPESRKTAKIRAGQVVMLGDIRIAVHEAD